MIGEEWDRTESALFAGILTGLSALLLGAVLTDDPALAGVAVFVSWTMVWWAIIRSPADLRVRRGALAGGIAALFTHVSYWVLVFGYAAFIGGLSPMSFLSISGLGLAFVVIGVVLLGGLTVPVGAVLGAGVVFLQSRIV